MYQFAKRLFDLILSFVLIILFFPIIVIISCLIILIDGGEVFFRQERIGKDFKPFVLVKFKTMRKPMLVSEFLEVEARITKLGGLLRRFSLDELPELVNILLGQMSFVGPRPLPIHYIDRFGEKFGVRHAVRPGLTGLAQIKGRKIVSWKNKLRYDYFYYKHSSFFLDMYIMLLTFFVVLDGELGDVAGEAEMPYFD